MINDKHIKTRRIISIKGVIYAIISSSSFGFSPLFSLLLIAGGLTTFDVLTYRWLVAAFAMFIIAKLMRKSLRLNSFSELFKIILLSVLRAATSITMLIAFENISSGVVSTINFLYPVVVAACMMMFFGDKFSWVTIGAIASSILGVYLLASGDDVYVKGGDFTYGMWMSLISVFTYAAYYILMKQTKADKIESVKFSTWMMGFCGIYFFLGCVFFDHELNLVTDPILILYILGIGLWATLASNFFGVKAVRRIGPTMTSILGALQPVTAVILGVIFLGETVSWLSLLGILIILAAVSAVVIHQKR